MHLQEPILQWGKHDKNAEWAHGGSSTCFLTSYHFHFGDFPLK
jgi:hypothetical protein